MRFALTMITALFLLSPVAFAQSDGHGNDAATHAEDATHGTGTTHAEPAEVIPPINQGLITGITSIVVFGVVMLVLGTQVWPKISKGLDERAEKIRSEIASAEAARKQARDALEQYEQALAEARAEAQKMLDDAKVQQSKLAADLRAKSDIELTAMRERAMSDIDAAKRTALTEIYSQTATLATSVAGKILKREITDQDQQALLEESLSELQSN